ncbi:MAG: glycogen synthase [Bacteroidota bacterium]|nr:glycogen synthase [Candidatus Kapabacteria bacterium]MCS7303308.1 glycogen synthase [Candidatus Kapabacteria bacterium]MCX7936961.1 glycogen synthase [Chlorobiota bacterium]MDW8075602.1 glycogen synthase [Bacteroidota bacterium]MDW8272105.1 glycogen synthase [Bacteroidota bacterium]
MPDRPLSILFVSSEVYPFAKTGGLADVSHALPIALRELGHDVRVMLPKYGNVSERRNRIHEINRLKEVPIAIGDTVELATIKSSSMQNPRTKVQAYVTTNFTYFDSKKGLYADPITGEPYNNDERFIFFDRSVVTTCLLLGWFPDIIHCNGWQTGLIGAYIRTMHAREFAKTKLVFTIHNAADQGVFPASSLEKTGLPKEVYPRITHAKHLNFTKAGMEFADAITTVSPTYAREILRDKTASGGTPTLYRNYTIEGILNGIDSYYWNPKTDPFIEHHYDSTTWKEGKALNKKVLRERMKLPHEEKAPLLATIARLGEAKGIPLLIEVLPALLQEQVQIVILGEGDPSLTASLEKLAAKHRSKLALFIGFDDALAHLIEAGADMYLMPSLFEPCGLNQMYSMAYGTVPIVRATGGLIDTVTEFDPEARTGTGFVFHDYTAEAFLAAIKRALALYKKPTYWASLVANCMSQDFSWATSARQYDAIYRRILSAR